MKRDATAKKPLAAPFRVEAATADLLKAVSRVAAVIARRNSIPILSFLEVAGGFGTIALRATDLDIEVRTEIKGDGEGVYALPAQRLHDLLRAVSHVERVTLEADDQGVVTLTAGAVTATMFSLPASDLPVLAIGDKVWGANLAEGVFGFLFGGVAHAMSVEETRYYLNGVCLEAKDGKLLAVATDGHRLCLRESALPAPLADQPGVIVPAKTVTLALGWAGKGEVPFSAHAGKGPGGVAYVELTAGGVRIRSKVIDGTYPDWRRVVPKAEASLITVDAAALRRALKVSIANRESRSRATKVEAADGALTLSSRSPDAGETIARLTGETTGPAVHFGVNGLYLNQLVEAMEKVGSKTVRVHAIDPGHPLRIYPDEAIAGVTNVLMPMRV